MMGVEWGFSRPSHREEQRGFELLVPGSTSSEVQMPCEKTKASKQTFMPLEASLEGRPIISSFGYPPSSGFQLIRSIDSNCKTSVDFPSQKRFIIDWQGAQPFQTDPHSSWGARKANEKRNHLGVPNYISFGQHKATGAAKGTNTAVTHVNWQQAAETLGTSAPFLESSSKAVAMGTSCNAPKTAQMTIFYAGSVNVYENISVERAHEIMSLATKESNALSGAPFMGQKSANIHQIPVDGNRESHAKDPPSPASVSSHFVGSFVKRDNTIGKSILDLRGARAFDSSSLIKALPMVRKASIARFLEKRKERLAIAVPYNSAQKSLENGAISDDTNTSKKPLPVEIDFASVKEPVSCVGVTSWNTNRPNSPNTNLEM